MTHTATYFTRSLHSRPRLARARVKLIHSYFKLMQLQEAERELDIQTTQSNSYAISDLGAKILFKLGKRDKLMQLLESALQTLAMNRKQSQHLYVNLVSAKTGGHYQSMADAAASGMEAPNIAPRVSFTQKRKTGVRVAIARLFKPLQRRIGLVRDGK